MLVAPVAVPVLVAVLVPVSVAVLTTVTAVPAVLAAVGTVETVGTAVAGLVVVSAVWVVSIVVEAFGLARPPLSLTLAAYSVGCWAGAFEMMGAEAEATEAKVGENSEVKGDRSIDKMTSKLRPAFIR